MDVLSRRFLWIPTLTLAAVAHAQEIDIRDLDRRLPTFLNDAYPLEKGDRQFHYDMRYDRRPGDDRFGASPEIQYGFARGWYLQVAAPVFFGGDRQGSGNVELELFKGSTNYDSRRTAFATAVRATLPTGAESRGLDADVEFIVTQPLRLGLHEVRAHANVAWEYNASPHDEEREHGYLAVAGLSTRLDERTLTLFDVARDQDPHERQTTNLGEIGLIRTLSRKTELALGLGFRLDRDSPATRFTVGIQTSF